MPLSFSVSPADRQLIDQIVERALDLIAQGEPLKKAERERRRTNLTMDMAACHASGNPLRLADMVKADDFNLFHDVAGISRHIDRETGELLNFFSPRFTDQLARRVLAEEPA